MDKEKKYQEPHLLEKRSNIKQLKYSLNEVEHNTSGIKTRHETKAP